MNSIRSCYEKFGVDSYYQNSKDYSNFHEEQIISILNRNLTNIDTSYVLDFCAGTGLVSKVLIDNNIKCSASDGYLYKEYLKSIKQYCFKLSFVDVVKFGLPENYSSIICSFALHLCPESMMEQLLWRLSEHSKELVVISPTKFPIIKRDIKHFDTETFKNGKRIYLRIFHLR